MTTCYDGTPDLCQLPDYGAGAGDSPGTGDDKSHWSQSQEASLPQMASPTSTPSGYTPSPAMSPLSQSTMPSTGPRYERSQAQQQAAQAADAATVGESEGGFWRMVGSVFSAFSRGIDILARGLYRAYSYVENAIWPTPPVTSESYVLPNLGLGHGRYRPTAAWEAAQRKAREGSSEASGAVENPGQRDSKQGSGGAAQNVQGRRKRFAA